ncbi:riboflavin synthase alpha chain [Brevibacterium sanguinis]|uniref:Riboflavin synthase n=2 Tax=Brevibacterium TaxID=1696 RepID=A0A366IDT0_9MICO|nr:MULTISPECIES: riboflavin synthase [Brevibacterium]RBP62538.1 riboflavin synthase alpha chain [Brevibacterium sanguinis]RBP69202.1 riboflavin synthase alpha chain [Brevibacterium celere]
MFTGIIERLGRVEAIELGADSAVITIDAGDLVADLDLGGSLAVNGVCLTSIRAADATGADPAGAAAASAAGSDADAAGAAPSAAGRFRAEVMGETLRLTGIGSLEVGDEVNLERCTPASGRLDGHVVQGHVDGCGQLLSRTDHDDWSTLRIGIPNELAPYTAVKGSIALNGVSLTLTAVSAPHEASSWVEVGLIPATLTHTTFGRLPIGAPVNIEVDVLAKYTARLLSFRTPTISPLTGGPASAGVHTVAGSASLSATPTAQGNDHV